MKYQSTRTTFKHRQTPKVGVLLTNLGTPDAATTPALRRYLSEFLSDPRVIEFPRWLWWCILHFIILRIRPRRSAAAYRSVWTEQGSPLALHTNNQAHAVAQKLASQYGDSVVVDWAMRYGNPSISKTLQKMMEQGVTKLLVLPLYPQYSASTTASTFDALAKDFQQRRWLPELRFINSYHEHDSYITAIANSISTHQQEHGKQEKLIFSYHGVPLRYLHNGDPYHCFCHQTTRLVAEKLGLEDGSFMTTFQSRFGREAWLKPYTDETLKALGKAGTKSVSIICPGFSSDCLETLEEIEEENKEYFLESGGESFFYIPALNSSDEHIDALTQICVENIQDWQQKLAQDGNAEADDRYNVGNENRPEAKA